MPKPNELLSKPSRTPRERAMIFATYRLSVVVGILAGGAAHDIAGWPYVIVLAVVGLVAFVGGVVRFERRDARGYFDA